MINTSTIVIGDALPSNFIRDIEYNPTNNTLNVANASRDIWRYSLATNTGEIIAVASSGHNKPTTGTIIQLLIHGSFFSSFISANLIWRWNEYVVEKSGSPIVITGNSAISYSEILGIIKDKPIVLTKLKYKCSNTDQQQNNIIINYKSIEGLKTQEQINILENVNPKLLFNVINIDLRKEILVDSENFLQMMIEGNTSVTLNFTYKELGYDKLIKSLNENANKDIGEIAKKENKQTSAVKESENCIKVKQVLNFRFLLIIAALFSLKKYLKNNGAK